MHADTRAEFSRPDLGLARRKVRLQRGLSAIRECGIDLHLRKATLHRVSEFRQRRMIRRQSSLFSNSFECALVCYSVISYPGPLAR